ncbi:MAG: hypothetical protein K0S74_461 [Chlamydiales bacterium]|jgi:hypothetical protein|nr:hypothetical protein [Chlamydiales bacterium]
MKLGTYLAKISIVVLALCNNQFLMATDLSGNSFAKTEQKNGLNPDKKFIDTFKKIRIEGNYQIQLHQGDECALAIQGDEELVSGLSSRVSNQTLIIKPKKARKTQLSTDSNQPILLSISFKELEKISIFGSSFVSTSNIEAKNLLIEAKGSVNGHLTLNAAHLKIKAMGACDLKVNGGAQDALICLDGSGNIDAKELYNEHCKVQLRGSGAADVNAISKLNVSIYGTGKVNYLGHAKVHSSLFGTGKVESLDASSLS